jgi:uncharacterized protein YbjT (DUF2867 family)
MTDGDGARPSMLLVGGGGGLVGRAVLAEFLPTHRIRSVHRRASAAEAGRGVDWRAADIAELEDWGPMLEGVDLVVNVAWHRAGPARRFVRLERGLERLLGAALAARVPRFVQISVPPAPAELETGLPYLVEKRRFDRALAGSGLSYRIVRPTMLFGPGDVLLGAMLRTIRRTGRLPLFGDGGYHLSPIAVSDLARVLRREAASSESGTIEVGGPRRYSYLELSERLFCAAGRPPRYWRMSGRSGLRLARLLELVGSRLLYRYEVEWLLSDRLGTAPYDGLDPPLTTVESYLGLPATN